MAFLTDRTLATGVTANDLIHIVITGDTSQNPAGSSYKATMGQVIDLINPTTLTGGTYDPLTGTITFYDDTGGSFNVTGLVTGYTNTAVTGLTYNNSNTFTILENDGTTHSASINVVTGMTFNGFLKTSGSTTSGLYSFAFGNNLTSSGDYSFSQGLNNTSSGNYSHSEGRGSTSSGLYSHAEGKGNDSSGSDSHAEGSNTISSGVSSHAEGDGTESFGASSHAEGQDTLAYGSFSHAEGSGTTTYGQYSHAEGLGTITNGDYQFTIGQFNSTASTQSAFIIGNGTSNTNRSNLVLATGNTFNIYGNLSVTGTTSSAIISATTYQNLPTDIRVTGGTYSNGTTIFTNNTGGTFSVSGFSTPFTGNTSGTCITDLYVTNVIGCSPLRIQPNSTDPVYISQSGGNVAIATTSLDGTAPEALVVSGSNSTSYNLIVGRASVNNYAQLNIVNKSAGLSSSADVVATNNTGTELVNFIDMGINGSNYAGGIIGVANDAYLFSTGRELYIGNATTGSTGNIRIFAGDPATNIDIFVSGTTGFVGIGTTAPTSRLDVNGTTKSSVISATTYQNLPTDVRVTGATYSNNTFTYTNNTGGTFNVLFNSVTGLTINGNLSVTGTTSSGTISATTYQNLPSFSGLYLPLSGGTLTGGLIANSGVTANTISQTSYIDFKTGSTNPSSVAGRLFFDTTQKSLSYFDITNNQVPIAMGQQLYTRVWNATGVQIDKGKVIAITGTSNNLPSAILAVNNHAPGSDRPIGVAAENIPNGSEGLVLNSGILSGITLNTFTNGDTLYLSDIVPGGYVSSTSSFSSFTARTNEIGYVIETGTTTGKIYVNINNEDSNLTLTDIERNILEGNVISTGTYEYTGMTINSSTTINVAPMRGWIVRNTYDYATLPDVTNLNYSGQTGITITNIATADATYVLVNSASTLYQQTTFPTPQQRRENIFLGKVVHPNRTSLLTVNNTVDYDVSPMSSLRDLWSPIKLINQGVLPSFNTGLTFNTSLGSLYGNGIGWTTNQLNPNSVTISAKTSASFFYRTQTGGTSGSVSVIDPTKYDVNGVITSVGAAGSNDATNQRIYLYPTGVINVLYGQTRYATLTEAISNIDSETFVTYPNAETTAILIGVISVRNDIVDDGQPLTNTNYAKLTLVSKFGESFGGTGGLSTTNLQQAYNNSTEPEILINSTLDGLSIQNGTGNADNVTQLLQGKNTAGTTTSFIRADGAVSGTSFSGQTFHISGTTGYNQLIVKTTYTPSGTTDTNGVLGDISWDASYVYVKTAAGWKRSGLATW
jgi:hypothetical protein